MQKSPLRTLLLTAIFAALTAIGAFLRIGVAPVTFSMQVFFTLAAGMLLGPRYGAVSQAVYVLLGLVGLPIFTEGGGPMYVAKPTFGFLLGLIPMAFVAGLLSRPRSGEKKRTAWRLFASGAAGLAAMYAIGLPYLWFSMGGAWSIGKTVVSGCLVFLPFDLLKLTAAAALTAKLSRHGALRQLTDSKF